MSETALEKKLSENKNLIRISSLDSIFNSKLFIDLDSTYEKSLNDSLDNDTDNSSDLHDIDNKIFLTKDLIDELDFSNDSLKDDNSLNVSKSLLSLVNSGYEFIPKGFKQTPPDKASKTKLPKNFNKYNMNSPEDNINNFYLTKNKGFIKERKGDWVCQICMNLNFSFRVKCNRCKNPKEQCLKKS